MEKKNCPISFEWLDMIATQNNICSKKSLERFLSLHVNNFHCNSLHSVTSQQGSTFTRRQRSDGVVLAVTERRRAEGERPLAAERSEYTVRHVIHKHPGADQDTSERHFIWPVCTIPGLRKTGSARRKTGETLSSVRGFSMELFERKIQDFSVNFWMFLKDNSRSIVFLVFTQCRLLISQPCPHETLKLVLEFSSKTLKAVNKISFVKLP